MAFIKKTYSDGFFNVSKENGFLPQKIPLERLPQTYSALQNILEKMPVKINNESGYLDKPGAIHKAVKSLPNYFEKVLHHTNTINSFCFL